MVSVVNDIWISFIANHKRQQPREEAARLRQNDRRMESQGEGTGGRGGPRQQGGPKLLRWPVPLQSAVWGGQRQHRGSTAGEQEPVR